MIHSKHLSIVVYRPSKYEYLRRKAKERLEPKCSVD